MILQRIGGYILMYVRFWRTNQQSLAIQPTHSFDKEYGFSFFKVLKYVNSKN